MHCNTTHLSLSKIAPHTTSRSQVTVDSYRSACTLKVTRSTSVNCSDTPSAASYATVSSSSLLITSSCDRSSPDARFTGSENKAARYVEMYLGGEVSTRMGIKKEKPTGGGYQEPWPERSMRGWKQNLTVDAVSKGTASLRRCTLTWSY